MVEKERRTLDGIVFDSKRQMERYAELKLLVAAGDICDLQLEPQFPVRINDAHYCTFTADFGYFDKRIKAQVIEDVKSTGTKKDTAYKLRKKAAELYHGIKVVEVIRR